MLSWNSFLDSQTFLQPIKIDDIHLDSAVDDKMEVENDLIGRCKKALNIIIVFVRPLPLFFFFFFFGC